MDLFGLTPTQLIPFSMLYGVTGVVPLIAALYLLLRRSNAFAPDVTPPLRLRRWTAAFLIVAALGHVWWYLFYVYSCNLQSIDSLTSSASYVAVVVLDCVSLLTTLAGTQLAMLQDRRRPVWPVFVVMLPFVAMGGAYLIRPSQTAMLVAVAYILLLYLLFTGYMVFAVRRYGRWLRDNYADLERKEVWLSQLVTLGSLLLFMLYSLVDLDSSVLIFFMHFTELTLFILLLWRVETLQCLNTEPTTTSLTPDSLTTSPSPKERGVYSSAIDNPAEEGNHSTLLGRGVGGEAFSLAQIEHLLAEHCVATQLYLRHDLTLQQLAQAVGTNRYYLSQYFSRQGITYNTYINNLRVNHFIDRYHELTVAGQPVTAQQLAEESGFRSYRTFSRAFQLRTGQPVTAWMNGSGTA